MASASAGIVRGIAGCEGLSLDLDALWAETERLALEPRPKRAATRRKRHRP